MDKVFCCKGSDTVCCMECVMTQASSIEAVVLNASTNSKLAKSKYRIVIFLPEYNDRNFLG